jgi:high-affinity K+ transport system ATPase subunit B
VGERARGVADRRTLGVGGVNWIWILLVAAVFVAGVVGVAAVRAAAEADRMRDAGRGADSYELHLLATMAAVARADLNAGSVEIVLCEAGRFARDGVVVTGSALPRGRAGARVVLGEGIAGRVLATGRTALVGDAMAAAIGGPEGPVGVVVAVVALDGPRFGPREVARLEALAAEAADRLGTAVGETA